MIIELNPGAVGAILEQYPESANTRSAPHIGRSGGSNEGRATWDIPHIPRVAVQGLTFITAKAGTRDRQVAEAEQCAFEQLQASSAPDSLAFWSNPQEDIYEDL